MAFSDMILQSYIHDRMTMLISNLEIVSAL